MKRIFPIIALLTLLAASCQDVVDIETDEITRSLNVYGAIDDTSGTTVSLSITNSYFEQAGNPTIDDAEVYLFEDGVAVGQLNSLGTDGRYELDYQGELGRSYHLEILLPDSYGLPVEWRSQPEELKRVFAPDSFSTRFLDRTTVPAVFDEGQWALLYFTEPAGLGDNYRIRRWLNDSLFTQEFFIFDDQNFDGANFGGQFPAFTIYGPLEPGDSMKIEISSLSGSYYEYLSLVNEQVFQIGGPFDPPPSPIVGNIYNADDPEDYGYGYFFATSRRFDQLLTKP